MISDEEFDRQRKEKIADFIKRVPSRFQQRVRDLLNGCDDWNQEELISRFLGPLLHDNNGHFEKIIQSPLFERFMNKYKSAVWGGSGPEIRLEVNFLHLGYSLFRNVDNVEKTLFLIELSRLADFDLDLYSNASHHNNHLLWDNESLTQVEINATFNRCLKLIQDKIDATKSPHLNNYKNGNLENLFKLFKLEKNLNKLPEKKSPPEKDAKIAYDKNLSDHHPQRAVIKSDKKDHHILIWNMTKRCEYSVDSATKKVRNNNGFGKHETDDEYRQRLDAIGEKLNEAIKADPDLGIIMLQEAKCNHGYLVDKIFPDKKKWSPSSNFVKGHTGELLTLYDNAKYETINIPPEKKKDFTGFSHDIHPILLRDRNTNEILLVVNIHAKYNPDTSTKKLDAELLTNLRILEQWATSNSYKLIIGGDFNRDIEDIDRDINFKNEFKTLDLSSAHGGKGSYSYGNDLPHARDGIVVGDGLAINKIELDINLNQRKDIKLDLDPDLKDGPYKLYGPVDASPQKENLKNLANKLNDNLDEYKFKSDPKGRHKLREIAREMHGYPDGSYELALLNADDSKSVGELVGKLSKQKPPILAKREASFYLYSTKNGNPVLTTLHAIPQLKALDFNQKSIRISSQDNFEILQEIKKRRAHETEYDHVEKNRKKIREINEGSPLDKILKDQDVKIAGAYIEAKKIKEYQKNIQIRSNNITTEEILEIQEIKSGNKIPSEERKKELEVKGRNFLIRGMADQYFDEEGNALSTPRPRIFYYACFPNLHNQDTPDFKAFVNPVLKIINKPEEYKQSVGDVIDLMLAMANENKEAIDIVTPNAFFTELSDGGKADAKKLWAEAVLERLSQSDFKTKYPNIPAVVLHHDPKNMDQMLKNKKDLQVPVLLNTGDASSPQRAAKELGLKDFQVAECLMGDVVGPAGHLALSDRADSAKEENDTRKTAGCLPLVFSSKYNPAINQAIKAEVKAPEKAEITQKPSKFKLFNKEEVEDYLRANYPVSGDPKDPNTPLSINRGFGQVPIAVKVGQNGELSLGVSSYNEAALEYMLKVMAKKIEDHGESKKVNFKGGDKAVKFLKQKCSEYGLEFETKEEKKKPEEPSKETKLKFPAAETIDKSLTEVPRTRMTGKMRS